MKLRHLIACALLTVGIIACRDDDPSRDAAPPESIDHVGPTATDPNAEADECLAIPESPSAVVAQPSAPCPACVPTRPPCSGSACTPLGLAAPGLLPSEVTLVAVGDSLTFGQGSTHPGGDTSYPAVLGRMLGVPAINRGVPGHGVKDLPDIDYLLVPGKQNRLVVMIGTNDLHNGFLGSPPEIYARLVAYVGARRAAGWLVTVVTPPQWLAATPASDRAAMEYEGLLRRGFPYVADVAASPILGRGSPQGPDRAYYFDEIGHLNDAGYSLLARLVKEAPAPRGLDPTVDLARGVPRTKSLTAWFRDWFQSSALPGELERPAKWLDMVEGGASSGGYEAFGPNRPVRVPDAFGGRPAVRFNGPNSGFFLPRDRLTGDYLRKSGFVISVVTKIDAIVSEAGAPYDHDGIVSDSRTRLGLGLRRPSTAVAFVFDGVKWTSREGTVPLDRPVVISMRLFRGKLGLRIGTTGSWSEIDAPDLDLLSGVFRIGTDSTNVKTFAGLVADVVVRKSYCDPTMAADDAYFRARYGVQ
ncbi:MAG: SGNH/GDSL hydrolase family protein [Deltaproteobacteria bacterium]|nr:SGNH/GDSL hydrolase family protein [Deltaproteobacteria bacterium]